MKTKTNSPAGSQANRLRVKSALKSGALTANHSQTLAGLRLKTAVPQR